MLRTRRLALLLLALVVGLPASSALATTIQDGAIFTIDEGVDFDLGNLGAAHFTFDWTDPGGGASFAGVQDPTLVLTAGETYTFVRTSGSHPFIIMDASAGSFITGTDGTYGRTSFSGAALDAATLTPIADFTANPAPSGDVITWVPTVGDYWYTCRVTGHPGMTGRIQVVPEPGAAFVIATVAALVARRRRRGE